jgi:hypothetical protein
LDILLAQSGPGKFSAQLLEINFCSDFTTLLRFQPGAVNDIFQACFGPGPAPGSFWQLEKEPAEQEAVSGLKELNDID